MNHDSSDVQVFIRNAMWPDSIPAGSTFRLRVQIDNRSEIVLRRWETPLGYRWIDKRGRQVGGLEIRTEMEEDIGPGQSGTLYALVKAPDERGSFTLELDFFSYKTKSWFMEAGRETEKLQITLVSEREHVPPRLVQSDHDYFLIIGCHRSGTSIVHSNLYEHPEIAALSVELKVSPLFAEGIDTFIYSPSKTSREFELGWREIYRSIVSLNADANTRVCGGKIAIGLGFHAKQLVSAISSYFPSLKIIVIERLDKVAQFGSLVHAKKSNIWWSTERSLDAEKLHLDEAELMAHVRHWDESYSELTALQKTNPYFYCTYEDLLADADPFMQQIYSFLGVRAMPFKESIRKLLPDPNEYIADYARLSELVAKRKR